MGCDIHLFVEKFIDNKWRMFGSSGAFSIDRNYMLFGLLAGVRNRDIKPISLPRGLPSDPSNGISDLWERYKDDIHTPSFYLLHELIDFRNNKKILLSGYLTLSMYKDFKLSNKAPSDWYTNFGFSKRKLISNKEMDRIIKLVPFLSDGEEYITQVECFFQKHLTNIQNIVEGDPKNIRLVFWFDN
jgi:hypothetical protein